MSFTTDYKNMSWTGDVVSYLVHFIPRRVEVLFDALTLKWDPTYVDFDVGVTLALHHASHQVVLGNKVAGLKQVNPQHPLQVERCNWLSFSLFGNPGNLEYNMSIVIFQLLKLITCINLAYDYNSLFLSLFYFYINLHLPSNYIHVFKYLF